MTVSARLVAAALAVVSAAATAGWTVRATEWDGRSLVLLALPSLGGLAAVVFVPALRRALGVRLVAVLSGVLLVLAVIPRPSDSADLWLYATYGRILVRHGDNPYVHAPAEYPHEPLLEGNALFRDRPALYGPVFIGMTGAVAMVAGSSRLAIRLAYQGGAALAVAASLLLLWRMGTGAAALASVGLNPILIAEVVTEGHNDAFIGLALLVAALLAARRPHLSALAIAVAALIKLPVAIALVGLVLWVRRHHDLRTTLGVAGTGALTIALGYLVAVGPGAMDGVLEAGDQVNEVNVWVPLRENGLAHVLGDLEVPLGPPGWTTLVAMVTALGLAVLLVASRADDGSPAAFVALPVVALLLTSPYPSPWYLAWVVPPLALLLAMREARLVLLFLALALVRYHFQIVLYAEQGSLERQALDDPLFRVLHVVTMLTAMGGLAFVVGGALTAARSRVAGRTISAIR